MFVFGVSLLRHLKFSSRNGAQKHIHQHTFRFTLAVAFPTYSIHPVSCTNWKDCHIGTTRCATSSE